LSVDSSGEVDSKVSTAVGAAQSALQTNIDGVSGRVTTLEGQNLDSRLSSAEGTIAGLGTMSTQNADNITITGGLIGAGSVPTDSGVILTENSTIDGGTFSGFNGGGGGGNSTSYAALFDGSSSLSLPGSFGVGSGDFTVEAFFKRDSIGAHHILVDQPNGIHLYLDGTLLTLNQCAVGNVVMANVSLDANWHHVAVVRESGIINMYVDGVVIGTAANSTDFTASGAAEIGAVYNQLGGNFVGQIGIVRVSNTARYAGESFSVPTGAFNSDGFTVQLLLQGSSVDGSLNPHGNGTMVAGPF
jgi:hypothetical protein